jgi:hypothetical protein
MLCKGCILFFALAGAASATGPGPQPPPIETKAPADTGTPSSASPVSSIQGMALETKGPSETLPVPGPAFQVPPSILAPYLGLEDLEKDPANTSFGFPLSRLGTEEGLAPEDKVYAQRLLTYYLDRDGIFTIVGGLKPQTYLTEYDWNGIFGTQEPVGLGARLKLLYRIQAWLSSSFGYEIVFHPSPGLFAGHDPEEPMIGCVTNVSAVLRKYAEHKEFFSTIGLDLSTREKVISSLYHPAGLDQILTNQKLDDIKNAIVYGYPHHSIRCRISGKYGLDDVDLVKVPNYQSHSSVEFSYEVPIGESFTKEDKIIQNSAKAIIDYYRRAREMVPGTGSPRPFDLVRSWFDQGTGQGSSFTAWQKALEASRYPSLSTPG